MCDLVSTSRLRAYPSKRRRVRAAFTIIEALVSVALMVAIMLAVANVFSMTSLASGRAVGQAETIEAAATFEQAVRNQLSKLKPDSLLIIESLPPLTLMPETKAGPNALSLRHDRLVFIAQSTNSDKFRSLTDRSVASNTGSGRSQFVSGEALVYFGPGDPDGRRVYDAIPANIALVPANEWILAQRIVLLGAPDVAGGAFASFTGETPLPAYPLAGLANVPARGIYACGVDAVIETGDALVARVANELASPLGDITGLWDQNLCPSEVNTVRPTGPIDNYAFYGRAAFNLQARITDLRIEWADGSMVDPTAGQLPDLTTQWFGQRRDTADIPENPPPPGVLQGWTGPADVNGVAGDVCEKREWLRVFDPAATLADSSPTAFGQPPGLGSIEFSTNNFVNGYGAIWTGPTWSFRPKALRFTFRVYDSQERLSTKESYDTTPWQGPILWAPGGNPEPLRRFGLEYSFVVPLPS